MAENRYLRWLSSETASVYWHDSAIPEELEEAMSNGAVGMTANPFLIASTLKAKPDFWRAELPGVPDDVTGHARAEEWSAQVTGWLARKLRPLREKGQYAGLVCAQTNPCRPGDVEGMIKTARHYTDGKDNIVVKFPATRGGLEAIEACAAEGNERAQLALDMFHYWVAKTAGGYAAAMNGVDAIVFTAGVGENSADTRAAICEYFGYLGVKIDLEVNNCRGKEVEISVPESPVKVFVIPTNEELVIARDTRDIVG